MRSHGSVLVTEASDAGKIWIANALFTVRYTRLPELLDELTVFKNVEWLKQRNCPNMECPSAKRARIIGVSWNAYRQNVS